MTKHMTTINRSNAYLGILAKMHSEQEARAIADTLNPPVAATRCGRTYQTHYFGDVLISYKRSRAAVMIRLSY